MAPPLDHTVVLTLVMMILTFTIFTTSTLTTTKIVSQRQPDMGRFSCIVSSATFYHLVDPLTAAEVAYNHLLAPCGQHPGVMLIRHVPLEVRDCLYQRRERTVRVLTSCSPAGHALY
jgi:hypothetical protein